jgi:hypothetical protein
MKLEVLLLSLSVPLFSAKLVFGEKNANIPHKNMVRPRIDKYSVSKTLITAKRVKSLVSELVGFELGKLVFNASPCGVNP